LSPSKSHQAAVELPSISPASHHPNLNESIKTAFMPLTFVIATEMEESPDGVQYYRKNEEMKKITSGESKATIHMR
jgi:hypothetical protein